MRALFSFIVVIVGVAVAGSFGVANAQTANPPSSTVQAASPPQASPGVDAEMRELKLQLTFMQKQVDTLSNLLTLVLGFVGLLTVYGIIRDYVVSSADSKLTDLWSKGESTRQSQANDIHQNFLKSSAETIRLVNDTLGLAKDASERAATATERKARTELESLDYQAKHLLTRVPSKDDRALTSNPMLRTELEGLAERINAFDVYRVILDDRISLTPHCHFVRGMHAHLRQHFDRAIEAWMMSAMHEKSDNALKASSYYWVGYENNNLGRFKEAARNFEEARRFAEGARKYELDRIAIESLFFDKSTKVEDALARISALLNEVEQSSGSGDIVGVKDQILGTAGNIAYVLGRDRASNADQVGAKQAFQQAREFFSRISERSKWSALGLAQCQLRLNEDVETAREQLQKYVKPAAADEFVKRVEHRTKALARFTELVCSLATTPKDSPEPATIYSQMLDALGAVDNRLTVYSLRQRRNVYKDEFQEDALAMMREATGS